MWQTEGKVSVFKIVFKCCRLVRVLGVGRWWFAALVALAVLTALAALAELAALATLAAFTCLDMVIFEYINDILSDCR